VFTEAIDEITLTIVHLPGQIIRPITSQSDLQTYILELFGSSLDINTRQLENQSKPINFNELTKHRLNLFQGE